MLYSYLLVKPVVPYLDYAIRNDFIAENLCVNRETPEKKCDGKCHLEKQLKKETADDNDTRIPPAPQNGKKEYQEYLIIELIYHGHSQTGLMAVSEYYGNYSFDYIPKVFHPPMPEV
jgi:hypothetical protein